MIRFWSITSNTFTQTIRQPIYGVIVLATFAVLVTNVPLSTWTMGTDYHDTDQRLLESLGLCALMWSGLLVAAFSASAALSREIEDHTVLTVISKPVSRPTFVLGKFAGTAAAATVAMYLCALVFLMTVRHKVMPTAADRCDVPVIVLGSLAFALGVATALLGNYWFGWPFVSTGVWALAALMTAAMGLIAFIGKGWTIVPFGADIRPELLPALGLVLLSVMVLVGVAIAASTRLGQIMSLLVCVAVLAAGVKHPDLFGPAVRQNVVLRLLSWVVPNMTLFLPMDAIAMDEPIPPGLVGLAAGYAACYVAAALAAAVALFHRRQIEAQGASSSLPGAASLLAWAGWTACLVLLLGVLVRMGRPQANAPGDWALAGGLAGAAVLGMLLWRCFGRGARWSWWAVLVLAGANLLRCLLALAGPAAADYLSPRENPVALAVQAILSAVVLLTLALPKTRLHFKVAR